MGTADLKTMKAQSGGKSHEMNVSTTQMAILTLFNRSSTLSYKDFKEQTQIEDIQG